VEICSMLLNKGPLIDCRDASGRTPCHHACSVGAVGILTLLIARGADIAVKDSRGISALFIYYAIARLRRPYCYCSCYCWLLSAPQSVNAARMVDEGVVDDVVERLLNCRLVTFSTTLTTNSLRSSCSHHIGVCGKATKTAIVDSPLLNSVRLRIVWFGSHIERQSTAKRQ
jgi:hypothetical protein